MTLDHPTDWYSPEYTTFGDRVAAAREAGSLSQKDLAKRLGIKLSTLQGWENDLSEPRANKLQMMAGILNVSITWLLNGEGEGLGVPEDDAELPGDLRGLVTEIRDMKASMKRDADRLGRIEKRLRLLLSDTEA